MMFRRKDDDASGTTVYVDPTVQLNAGLWTLFAGATVFLAIRVWIKITRRHGLWWDDHILLVTWIILLANNSIISAEFATGYVAEKWDDRMHILINITSCGTLLGQALSKTAFAVTLLKLTHSWQRWILWFCIASMNIYMVVKVILQWAKVCGNPGYDVWYRLDVCLQPVFRDRFKEGGQVYNIIMDFVLAAFPWMVTWKLDMRKVEKIGLCVTMSLGMVVAIVAAIRISWKEAGNQKDALYFWRNAHSNIWYSSEIVGTIIVQCIPVLRPLLRDIHLSMTSKRLQSAAENTARRSKMPMVHVGNPQSHETHIHSDVRSGTFDDAKHDCDSDPWDSQGIYQKIDFELTTMEIRAEKGGKMTSLV